MTPRPRSTSRLSLSLLFAGIAFLLAMLAWQQQWTQPVENLVDDWKCRLMAPLNEPGEEIVIVTITDESLNQMQDLGRWPWPRSLMAGLVNYCREARVISIDILFSETGEGDAAFSNQIAQAGNVVSAMYLSPHTFDPSPPRVLERSHLRHWPADRTPPFPSVIHPIPEVMEPSAGLGFVNFWRSGAIARTLKLAAPLGTNQVPSLALATFLAAQGVAPEDVRLENGRFEAGDSRVRLEGNDLRLSWRGTNFQSVDAADIFHSYLAEAQSQAHLVRIARSAFQDKIVLIGMEASGLLRDLEVTPVNRELPGVVIHATAVDNLLQSEFLRTPPRLTIGLLTALLCFLPAVLTRRPAHLIWTGLGLGLAVVTVSIAMALLGRWMVPIVPPLVGLGLSGGLIGLFHWRRERGERRHLQALEARKQAFTDMLVHDLKNTVSPVLMSVDMVRSEPESEFSRVEFPLYVEQTYNQLLLQVNSILDIRKMEEGRLPLDPSSLSPFDLIQDLCQSYEGALKRMHLTVELKEEEGVADELIRGDLILLRRVLENLLWNALKYATPSSAIEARCSLVDRWYEIGLANDCTPISPDKLDRLFGTFVTGDVPRNIGNITSSGLGLAFCKLAVEAHGGKVVVNSPIPGRERGFQATVRLPRGASPGE